jgi:hypothetical protein
MLFQRHRLFIVKFDWRVIIHDDCVWILKEVVVTYFQIVFRYSPEGHHQTLAQIFGNKKEIRTGYFLGISVN